MVSESGAGLEMFWWSRVRIGVWVWRKCFFIDAVATDLYDDGRMLVILYMGEVMCFG